MFNQKFAIWEMTPIIKETMKKLYTAVKIHVLLRKLPKQCLRGTREKMENMLS